MVTKKNRRFIDRCFPRIKKEDHVNIMIKQFLQFRRSGYSPCNGNIHRLRTKFLRSITDPLTQERELAQVRKKFANNPKVLQEKIREIKHFHSEMKIRFCDFKKPKELKVSYENGLKNHVTRHWRLSHFSVEYVKDVNVFRRFPIKLCI